MFCKKCHCLLVSINQIMQMCICVVVLGLPFQKAVFFSLVKAKLTFLVFSTLMLDHELIIEFKTKRRRCPNILISW